VNKMVHVCCVCGRWWAEHLDDKGKRISMIPELDDGKLWQDPNEARLRGLESIGYRRTHTYCPPCKRAALEELEGTCADSE